MHAYARFAQPYLDEPLALTRRLWYLGRDGLCSFGVLRRRWKLHRDQRRYVAWITQLTTVKLSSPGVKLVWVYVVGHRDIGARNPRRHAGKHDLSFEIDGIPAAAATGGWEANFRVFQLKCPFKNTWALILTINVYEFQTVLVGRLLHWSHCLEKSKGLKTNGNAVGLRVWIQRPS